MILSRVEYYGSKSWLGTVEVCTTESTVVMGTSTTTEAAGERPAGGGKPTRLITPACTYIDVLLLPYHTLYVLCNISSSFALLL